MKKAAETDIHSVYVAAQFAIEGFDRLHDDFPHVFIVTGNAMPFQPAFARFLSLGYARVRNVLHSWVRCALTSFI